MLSYIKTYDEEKTKGKVYTPHFIVQKILDDIGYTDSSVLCKYILEPSCGDGQFLSEIVKRICMKSNETNVLEHLQYVYAFDIDRYAIEKAKNKLNQIVFSFFPSLSNQNIHWNIFHENTLYLINQSIFNDYSLPLFDFIVGNPPYIRIQHLELPVRKFIQKHFHFCKKGSTDIFIAFFELAIHLLHPKGKCGFITPNTYFYTETAQSIRHFFQTHQNIIQITNYNDIQIFPNKSTYTAITIFGKEKQNTFKYQHAINHHHFTEHIFSIQNFHSSKRWNFHDLISNNLKKLPEPQTLKLSDIAEIHVGLTTLCDKFYILEKIKETNEQVWEMHSKLAGNILVEKNILKPILKASRPKQWNDKKQYIIFPYHLIQNKYSILSENEMKENFPLAYQYFIRFKDILLQRDKGKINPVGWYAFGRHQGLQTSFGEKILFSNMMKEPQFIYIQNPDFTFYSGYCIKLKTTLISYEQLLKQLNSERMKEFVAHQSRSFRNGWKAYNKKVIEDFKIYLPENI